MDGDPDDIQAQVLQTTLTEIETSRQHQHQQKQQPQHAADGPADTPADPCCVVCLDSVSDPCTALPCGHTHFDFLCIVSWLQEHPNCPLCKANVYKVRYADPQRDNADAFYRVPNAPRARNTAVRDDERRAAQNSSHTHLSSASPRSALPSRILRTTSRRCPRPPPSPDEAIQRRRRIYRHQLYSLHIGSNRISQYRPPPTPVQFSSTPHLVTRARLWIRRELQVFSFLSDPDPATDATPPTDAAHRLRLLHRRRGNAEFLLEYVVAVLKTVDLQGSAGQAEAMLADFLGREHARLFLHELRSWLRSPAQSLAAWDREVQYPEPEAEPEDESEVGRGIETETGPSGGGSGSGRAGYESGEGGRSWRDRGGDHWRAGPYPGERGKRKRREGDEAGEGRASRPRGERERGPFS
ncbi:hypothetical protein C8A05DRAFT_13465 [Staphylotrichum tortipilum]|uniref:RING-type E3 ubiquitin transferase n=1 Tax=Staphylotrichum tortipilum TaxID=2831512 RepID=A0AAN6MPF3_9PEZI|nr:hypothetical protein C8A05DRAFT_13465 [Staphylotrichum longicolle]